MGNEDNSQPLRSKVCQVLEQPPAFLRCQYRRRLVEYQNTCTPIERLGNLDLLLLGYRGVPDGFSGVERQAESLGKIGDFLFRFPSTETESSAWFYPQDDIFRNSQSRD